MNARQATDSKSLDARASAALLVIGLPFMVAGVCIEAGKFAHVLGSRALAIGYNGTLGRFTGKRYIPGRYEEVGGDYLGAGEDPGPYWVPPRIVTHGPEENRTPDLSV